MKGNLLKINLTAVLIIIIVLTAGMTAFAQCDPPLDTGPSNRTISSIRVNWFSLDSDNIAWELELIEKGEMFSGIPTTPAVDDWHFDFTGLKSGTEYHYNIRSICASGTSEWNGPYKFITSLSNDERCNLNFQMDDPSGNDAVHNYFYLMDTAQMDRVLGEELFIKNVELIIAHEWPADLTLKLRSPAGKEIVLSNREGFNSNHYGLPGENCESKIVFSDDACNSVIGQIPLIGSFRPEESFEKLYDNTPIDGNWILDVQDNSPGHRGILKYFRINLVEAACRLPQELYLNTEDQNAVRINWFDEIYQFDSLKVEFGSPGFTPGTGDVIILSDDQHGYVLDGLEPEEGYDFYFTALCGSEISDLSCNYYIETACHQITLKENFEDEDLCELNCQTICQVSDTWFNRGAPYNQWLVQEGETTTESTGPQGDISGFGKYIYVESSENNCGFDTVAVLETDCLEIFSNGDGCDFSFNYHMEGPDIGTLKLQLSTNDGESWQDMWILSGTQGNSWNKAVVDFAPFHGLVGRLRFVAELSGPGLDRGDIALDEIVFYGTKPVTEAQYLFYTDADHDNYGNAEIPPVFFCSNSLIEGFSRNDLDCDDTNNLINPEATEIPCNAIDENCNGMEDDLDLQNPMLVDIADLTNESCEGLADGTITIQVSGGQAPYSYSWSNGSVDSLLTSLEDGKYFCEVTDAFGCKTATDSIVVEAGPSLEFELVDKSIISCGGARDGSISIAHYGGTGPYTYLWNNGDTTQNLIDLETGSYQVTITDSIGCQVISPDIDLVAATNFIVGLDIRQPLCHGEDNGYVNILGIQDGIPPYTYLWSTGDTTEQINMLNAGSYSLTVTDGSYCYEVIDSIVIKEPEPLGADIIAKDDVSCFGSKDGAIEVNATGGKSPYTFQWTKDGNVFSNKDDLFNLGSGSYQLRVRDDNGCEHFTDVIEISQPDQIDIILDSIVHADCRLSANGSISISVDGGTGDYHFYWNGTSEDGPVYDQLNPGLYNVVVTDRYGCKAYKNGLEVDFLDIPIELELDLLEDIPCFGDSSALIEVVVDDAAKPLDFNWSAGVKKIKNTLKDTLQNLPAGAYNITVTDAEGCIGESGWLTIEQPQKLAYEVEEVIPVECAGDLTGLIRISVRGGTGDLIVKWNNGKEGSEIRNINGGYYHAVIADSNNCVLQTDSIYLYEASPITVIVSATPAGVGQFDGTATVLPQGGTTPYYYKWDENAGFQTNQTAVGLDTGTYHVEITDYYGCYKEALVIVPLATSTSDNSLGQSFIIYPNPTVDRIVLSVPVQECEDYGIEIINASGQSFIHGIKPFCLDDHKMVLTVENLPEGIYFVRINSSKFSGIARFVKTIK